MLTINMILPFVISEIQSSISFITYGGWEDSHRPLAHICIPIYKARYGECFL